MAQVTPQQLGPFIALTLIVAFAGATPTLRWMPTVEIAPPAQGAGGDLFAGLSIALIVPRWRWCWPIMWPEQRLPGDGAVR